MAEAENIKAFNWLCLWVLDRLYTSFPEPIDIDGLREVIREIIELGPESEQSKYLSHLSATIEWLAFEGVIRYERSQGENYYGVVLTAKGLAALGYKVGFPFLRKETIIDKIKVVIKKRAVDSAPEIIQKFLEYAMLSQGISL